MEPISLFWNEFQKKDLIKYKDTLIENGFDEWETIEELNEEVLKQLSKIKIY